MATKKYEGPRYAYTQGVGKTADDKFDIEAVKKGEARVLDSDVPDQKAMRYIKDDSLSEFLGPGAGGGRGGQGGPTAKELQAYEDKKDARIFTKGKKMPPSPREMAKGGDVKFMSFTKTGKPAGMKSVTKMASGGMTASKRADGCCVKGKTRGKMV